MKLFIVSALILAFSFGAEAANVVSIDDGVDLRTKANWTQIAPTEKEALQKMINILKGSKTARKILNHAAIKAQSFNQELIDVIAGGEVSMTDTRLVRSFHAHAPENVVYKEKSNVYVNRSLNVLDGTTDLIHELTHYGYKKIFNPYQNDITVSDYVTSIISGVGGEADAYIVECQVLKEIDIALFKNQALCQKLVDPRTQKLSKYHSIREFFKTGKDYPVIVKKMKQFKNFGKQLPITDDEITFVSSVRGTSYPLAAILEYEQLMKKTCANEKRRMGILYLKNSINRSPASSEAIEEIKDRHNQYCD